MKFSLWHLVIVMALSMLLLGPRIGVLADPVEPSLAIVKAACLRPTNDLHLDAYVYYQKYLFCNVSDDYTAAQDLYLANGQAGFAFVRGSGGEYRAKDLVKLAKVPPEIASYLVNMMKKKMDALQHGLQKPLN